MPFAKGRKKTGGRKPGAVTFLSLKRDVVDKLSEIGFDPILKLVELAESPKCSESEKRRICSELAQYVHPKKQAIALTGEDGGPIQVNVSSVELFKSRIDRIVARKPA